MGLKKKKKFEEWSLILKHLFLELLCFQPPPQTVFNEFRFDVHFRNLELQVVSRLLHLARGNLWQLQTLVFELFSNCTRSTLSATPLHLVFVPL